jgi:Methyltransferase domain
MTGHYDESLLKTHLEESHKRMPGADYHKVLQWVHRTLRPPLYIEIGVNDGASLKFTKSGTKSIGIDPYPRSEPMRNVEIFSMTSDEFFEKVEAGHIKGAHAFSLAFIDGLHTYDQALRDFVNLEKISSAESVIMLHDCIPLDVISASNPRASHFYTGDVWKTLLIIARNRPDLNICIFPAWPSGLVLITGLNSESELLEQNFSALVDQYRSMPFEDYRLTAGELPPPVPIKKSSVKEFLKTRQQSTINRTPPPAAHNFSASSRVPTQSYSPPAPQSPTHQP